MTAPSHPAFWISQEGRIVAIHNGQGQEVDITMAFPLRNGHDIRFARRHLSSIQFSERSSLARVGIEIITPHPYRLQRNQVVVQARAFLYDATFPSARFFPDLLKNGTPVGRLFYAPETLKLTSDELWQSLRENRLKLPNTISIDRFGRVFLTPHRVKYTLPEGFSGDNLHRVVQGLLPRSYLDKIQVRQDMDVLSIPPQSGILTSCSMYLQEHYVVLNRGEGNFGLHSGAVLLDPVKTFGTNVILEIYNTSDDVVVNPMVSVEVYRMRHEAEYEDPQIKQRRVVFFEGLQKVYERLQISPKTQTRKIKPRVELTLANQEPRAENPSVAVRSGNRLLERLTALGEEASYGYQTVAQALSHVEKGCDTLVVEYFPNLFEHIELLTRLKKLQLRKLVFRKAGYFQHFFLSGDAHSRLETYQKLGIEVYWHNEALQDLYVHRYKKDHGFFIREEQAERFITSTILAFYGSAYSMESQQATAVQDLVTRMTDFFGPNVGILTGGGGGVMGLATEVARDKNILTGASFLELESQPPNTGVDFFNTFQENNRHNRQKWFQVADFCIFNMGGVGTLEEIGIELCNLKLGIRPRVPYVFYHDTFWECLREQFLDMIRHGRAPAWMADYVLFTGKVSDIIQFYRKTLQIL